MENNNYPFEELKFIIRVLDLGNKAVEEDMKTARKMACEIFYKWHAEAMKGFKNEST